jgi:Ras GTPase-activating-like protein IQGAP2/3
MQQKDRAAKLFCTLPIDLQKLKVYFIDIDPALSQKRQLIAETKQLVITVLRISSGNTLLKLLEEPVSQAQQDKFKDYVQVLIESTPKGHEASLGFLKNSSNELCTFSQLKCKTLEKMALLEKFNYVSISNDYQSMIDYITEDVLCKQKVRNQRLKQINVLKNTLVNLSEKAKYLSEQKDSYTNYINACMQQLQAKVKTKGKDKRPALFTKQYYHVKELEKVGKMPKFGSYMYSADQLYKKGVLISIDDYTPKQYGGISLTISSNEAGVFTIDATFLGVKFSESMELRLDELLQNQYNQVDVLTLFDIAKVNLNLLIFLINKKYMKCKLDSTFDLFR